MSEGGEAERLEELWAGKFGDEYVDRNIGKTEGRDDLWVRTIERLGVSSVLEVGCNVGLNLEPISRQPGVERVAGVDINRRALEIIRERIDGVDAREARARELPFGDGEFELVFTVGVLIHQPVEELDDVLREIVRCSSRYILCSEYYADEVTEIPYRGQEGALFKRDFGGRYQKLFPDLKLVHQEDQTMESGYWEDTRIWIFEKPSG